ADRLFAEALADLVDGAVGYGTVALEAARSVPDEFRKLAEKEL
ncbi:MAG: DNA polymerase IV, partial [Mesorhizobium sp.]